MPKPKPTVLDRVLGALRRRAGHWVANYVIARQTGTPCVSSHISTLRRKKNVDYWIDHKRVDRNGDQLHFYMLTPKRDR